MYAGVDLNNIYDPHLTLLSQNDATHARTRIARTALTLPSHTSDTIITTTLLATAPGAIHDTSGMSTLVRVLLGVLGFTSREFWVIAALSVSRTHWICSLRWHRFPAPLSTANGFTTFVVAS